MPGVIAAIQTIGNHIKLTFVAERPPHLAYQEHLMAAEPSRGYFS